jgi:hypothetical protein
MLEKNRRFVDSHDARRNRRMVFRQKSSEKLPGMALCPVFLVDKRFDRLADGFPHGPCLVVVVSLRVMRFSLFFRASGGAFSHRCLSLLL